MRLSPSIVFNGNCEEAITFYKECLGGDFVSFNRFRDGLKEINGIQVPEHLLDKIMHMSLKFGQNYIMASDSLDEAPVGGNISLFIDLDDVAETNKVFDKLSQGAKVNMPLQDTFWGARFGMLTDKFSVKWVFNCRQNT